MAASTGRAMEAFFGTRPPKAYYAAAQYPRLRPRQMGALSTRALGQASIAPYVGTEQRVWETGDDGASWQFESSGLISSGIQSLVVTPTNPFSLLAATAARVWVSQDRGVTRTGARPLGRERPHFLLHTPARRRQELVCCANSARVLPPPGRARTRIQVSARAGLSGG